MKIRTFIAIEIDSIALNELLRIRDEIFSDLDIKFEPKEKIHITIKFIGDIDDAQIPELECELQKVAESISSFNLKFSKFGLFKKHGIPSILWAGINESNELCNLHFEVQKILTKLGFEIEKRKFKPHLTLLRFKKEKVISNINSILNKNISQIKFGVSVFTLFKSELKPSGSDYSVIKIFKLK